MVDVSASEIITHMSEEEQRQAAIMRAILSVELDRWDMERRNLLQHPQAQSYVIDDEALSVYLECDWFYIIQATPPVDFFKYILLDKGGGRIANPYILPRNVKRYGPVRVGIKFLPLGKQVKFILVWGIGVKDSNLSFQSREADEDFEPKTFVEQTVAGPTLIFPGVDNRRVLYKVWVDPATGFDVQDTDSTGTPTGGHWLSGSVSWVGGKAAADELYLKSTGPPVLVRATGWNVQRIPVDI